MRFGSVCSGIEAASVAWEPLGWQAAWFAEIEPFPSAVLTYHYANVKNLGDMTALPELIRAGEVEAPEVFCGGTPCQAFSVAGLRQSLDDARGNLSLTFCEIANAIDDVRSVRGNPPVIVFWENVPGVLSTADNAFGCFLAGLAGEEEPLKPAGGRWTNAGAVLGPKRSIAWRTLDAQYFGLAQRRKRVFVVASARDWFDPAAILFEFEGVRRDSAPSREKGEDTSGSTGDGVARCITAGEMKRQDFETCTMVAHTLRGEGFDASEDGTGRGTPIVPVPSSEIAHAILANEQRTYTNEGNMFQLRNVVAQPVGVTLHGTDGTQSVASFADLSSSLRARVPSGVENSTTTAVLAFRETADCLTSAYGTKWNGNASADNGSLYAQQGMQVRRLTPVECERLQGFPDSYTAIPWRNKPASECPDGPRYKALGNSWAVPVVRWIGQRIHNAVQGKVS